MKASTALKILGCGLMILLGQDTKAQLIKKINFSRAEGYTNGPLWGQPSGAASVWTCVSDNKGNSFFTNGAWWIVHTITNESMIVSPDQNLGTNKTGTIYWAIPFPAQKKGPVTVTWDWQFFPTNQIPADYDPTNRNYRSVLQGTDCGFTLSDSANRMVDGNPYAVFNELSTPSRIADLADTRNGTGSCDGNGTWLNVGPEFKDGKKLHMKVTAYFGDASSPYNNTFDAWAQREGEDTWQTANHNYMRRCPTAGNGIDCISMWLNGGLFQTRIVVDNIRVVGPDPVETPAVQIALAGQTVTLTFTGTLQSADAPEGPYTDLAESDKSPLEVPAAGPAKFFRASN